MEKILNEILLELKELNKKYELVTKLNYIALFVNKEVVINAKIITNDKWNEIWNETMNKRINK